MDCRRLMSVASCAGLLAVCLSGTHPFLRGGERLAVFPPSIELAGPHASQSIVVQRIDDAGRTGSQVDAGELAFEVDDTGVARWQEGRLVPVADGETTLRIRCGKERLVVPVSVRGMDEP
ncbi:MAG TPA: hypothetical protein ENJ50_05970, partial [Planctomycetaceae bacterium]|nr:hypothetical protein [Planctomycetaceae bacterium]